MNASDAALLRRYRMQLFTATWLSYAGFYLCRKVYAVVKHELKLDFGFNDEQIALPWTIYLICYMLGQFLAAWLGRRMESRRVLAWGMTLAAASNIGLGWLVDSHHASELLWICVLMGIHGVAQATGWPHNVALFANWTHRSERGTLFGVWGTCYQLGAVAGKGLAGFLLGWLGLAWSFYGSSIVFFVITAAFVLLAKERPQSVGLTLGDGAEPDAPTPAPSTPAAVASTATVAKGARAAPREAPLPPGFVRAIVAMGLIYFGMKFLRYALDSWSALILGEHFALSSSVSAYLSTAFDWIGLLGVIFGGWWSDRMPGSRRTPVIFYMSLCCLACTFLMWLVGLSTATVFVVLLGLIGFFEMGPDALLSGACAMDIGSRRQASLAAGVINGFGSIGPIVQEPLIGWLKQHFGLDSVFMLLVIVGAVTTIATWLLMRYERGRV